MFFEYPDRESRVNVYQGAFYHQNRGRCVIVTVFDNLLRNSEPKPHALG